MCSFAVPPDSWIGFFEPLCNASNGCNLCQEGKGEDRRSFDVHCLSGIVGEKLKNVVEWSPNTLGDGEEDWDLL